MEISCPQNLCSHNQVGYGRGCRKCDECRCEANIIDKNCDRCMSCATKNDCLRWDDNPFGQVRSGNKEIKVEIK